MPLDRPDFLEPRPRRYTRADALAAFAALPVVFCGLFGWRLAFDMILDAAFAAAMGGPR